MHLPKLYYTVEKEGLVEPLFPTIYDDQTILKRQNNSNF